MSDQELLQHDVRMHTAVSVGSWMCRGSRGKRVTIIIEWGGCSGAQAPLSHRLIIRVRERALSSGINGCAVPIEVRWIEG